MLLQGREPFPDRRLGQSHFVRHRLALSFEVAGSPVGMKNEMEKKPHGVSDAPVVLAFRVHDEASPHGSPPSFVVGHDWSMAKRQTSEREEEFPGAASLTVFVDRGVDLW